MAADLGPVLIAAMALARAVVDAGFHMAGLAPTVRTEFQAERTRFGLDQTC